MVKRLAALLVLAAILFAALVIVPQLRQAQIASPGVVANADGPVDANSLLGMWAIDGEASWEMTRINPLVAKRLAGMRPDGVERVKASFLNGVTATSIQFTANTMTLIGSGAPREEKYTISALDGNVLTVDIIGMNGKVIKNKATVDHTRLELFDPSKPDMTLVFNRAR